MVGTRRRPEVERDPDSESDAPEQVTLSSVHGYTLWGESPPCDPDRHSKPPNPKETGRKEAQKLRNEERENQKRVQAEAKQRRRRNDVKKKEEAPPNEQEVATVLDTLEEASAKPVEDEQELEFSKPGKISGFLDSSIVDFLSAQEKKAGAVNTSTTADETPRIRNKTKKRKGTSQIIPSSRVKVVLLKGEQPSSANYQSALEFKHKRLYGERVHRSLNMLPKTRAV